MESGITPVMNVGNGYGDGFGSYIWLFAILALMNGGFGGWGNRGSVVTESDLANQSNFTRLESQVMGNGQAIAQGFRNVDNAVCQIGYQNLQNTSNLSSQLADCCCTTQRAVDSVKFDMANYAAAINANNTANTQKVLDAIAQNKIEGLQAQVNQLQLNQALCGVVRYPTSATYATYCNPFGYNGCGCNTNI